jgi:membrane associated rhomboid family serine protease
MVMFSSISMGESLDFFLAILPIVGLHLVLPPIAYFRGERLTNAEIQELLELVFYSSIPKEFFNEKFISHLTYDSAGKTFTLNLLRHIFVHANYDHLFSNLSAASQLSFPVYREFGGVGLYILFFSGGVLASIPTFLHKDQKLAFSHLIYDKIAIKPSGNSNGGWIPGLSAAFHVFFEKFLL